MTGITPQPELPRVTLKNNKIQNLFEKTNAKKFILWASK